MRNRGSNASKMLRAFVRIDGQGFVIPGSLIFRRRRPSTGRWLEIDADRCCTSTTTTTTTAAPTTTTTTTTTAP
jgi:hypothetical protein